MLCLHTAVCIVVVTIYVAAVAVAAAGAIATVDFSEQHKFHRLIVDMNVIVDKEKVKYGASLATWLVTCTDRRS